MHISQINRAIEDRREKKSTKKVLERDKNFINSVKTQIYKFKKFGKPRTQ